MPSTSLPLSHMYIGRFRSYIMRRRRIQGTQHEINGVNPFPTWVSCAQVQRQYGGDPRSKAMTTENQFPIPAILHGEERRQRGVSA